MSDVVYPDIGEIVQNTENIEVFAKVKELG